MAVALRSAPVLLEPAGSHWLELESGPRRPRPGGGVEPFAREELHPVVEVEVPRVGVVRAVFSVDRYVASSYDERTGTSSPVWTDWRVYLRDVRTPDPDRPGVAHLGRDAVGVGDATHRAISEACVPLIRAWLETDEYRASRERAAAYAAKRELDAPASYRLANVRTTLEQVRGSLGEVDAESLFYALGLLESVGNVLDQVPAISST